MALRHLQVKTIGNLYKWRYNYWKELKTLWQSYSIFVAILLKLVCCGCNRKKVSVFGKGLSNLWWQSRAWSNCVDMNVSYTSCKWPTVYNHVSTKVIFSDLKYYCFSKAHTIDKHNLKINDFAWYFVYYRGISKVCITERKFNPFPHKDAFWRLCSRQLFENMATKEEIAQNKQFLLLSPCFQINSILVLSFKGIFCTFLLDVFKVVCCRFVVCGNGLNITQQV